MFPLGGKLYSLIRKSNIFTKSYGISFALRFARFNHKVQGGGETAHNKAFSTALAFGTPARQKANAARTTRMSTHNLG